ncbi:MAG TPA: hypothetical protein VMB27_08350 [Solirubrobacteraceae bacterium]|nr:hypothetical protein [Solirubrobacteraceae bacterium]
MEPEVDVGSARALRMDALAMTFAMTIITNVGIRGILPGRSA